MMRKIFITTLFMLISVTAMSQKTFGYLSYFKVLQSTEEYSQIQNEIQQLKDESQREMTRASENFSKQFAEYIDGQKTFSENIMMKRQKELQQLMNQSLQYRDEARKLIERAEKELMQPLYDKLNNAIQIIGAENDFEYILNTDNNSYPFINTEKGEDITEKVLILIHNS
ncbi:MAG: OmpH family outer membrane protein [Prevotellaceae bacterium]|nr:OmpH family outer membrane protein [Candidatus Colivivens equi]MCQ2076837.1 OmpH family outer membrane protein [Bacteroidaceae bacterium]